jgi:hypothetical protein
MILAAQTYAVGFDPGGKDAFGWAVIAVHRTKPTVVASGTCTGARHALDAARRVLPEGPIAVGTDSPLYWVLEGDRRADIAVRQLVRLAGGSSGTVSHVNSLRGACLVEGVMATKLATDEWHCEFVTEAHPKALLLVSATARRFVESQADRFPNEHARDAALAAFAAIALSNAEAGWHDLAILEDAPYFPGGSAVAYYFPRTRT